MDLIKISNSVVHLSLLTQTAINPNARNHEEENPFICKALAGT
jgi:hypothetical protein